jgi:hypothetical protein
MPELTRVQRLAVTLASESFYAQDFGEVERVRALIQTVVDEEVAEAIAKEREPATTRKTLLE